MARTDTVTAALVKWMDAAFNDEERPPAGGLSGGCQVRPGMGLPALDNFDTCTLAWVLAGMRGVTSSFPVMDDAPQCGGRMVVEFSVGIARCSTALGDQAGFLPTREQMEAEFAVQEDDKDRLWSATCRAVSELKESYAVTNAALLPIETYGPEGATVAVHRSLILELGKGH